MADMTTTGNDLADIGKAADEIERLQGIIDKAFTNLDAALAAPDDITSLRLQIKEGCDAARAFGADIPDDEDEPKWVVAAAIVADRKRRPSPSEDVARLIELARDLVALWESPNIKALKRSERNEAIEATRQQMIEAVAEYEGRDSSAVEHLICNQGASGSSPLPGTIPTTEQCVRIDAVALSIAPAESDVVRVAAYWAQAELGRDAAESDAARLREALEPFARLAECVDEFEKTDDEFVAAFDIKGRRVIATAGDVRRARAALIGTGGGWKDIETAPKDGSYILVTNGRLTDVARWSHGSFGGFADVDATHWRPLPSPPSGRETKTGDAT